MIFNRGFVHTVVCCLLLSGCATDYKSTHKTGQQYLPPQRIKVLESDYLEATPGYRGNVLGAEIVDTEVGADQQTIEINLPIDPDQVDQVRVVSPTGESLKQYREPEILRDYENNKVGVKIFLPRQKNLGFRLRLIDNVESD
jgi:hypothetical protein